MQDGSHCVSFTESQWTTQHDDFMPHNLLKSSLRQKRLTTSTPRSVSISLFSHFDELHSRSIANFYPICRHANIIFFFFTERPCSTILDQLGNSNLLNCADSKGQFLVKCCSEGHRASAYECNLSQYANGRIYVLF